MIQKGLIFEIKIDDMIGTVVAFDHSFIIKQTFKTGIIVITKNSPPFLLPSYCSAKPKHIEAIARLNEIATLIKFYANSSEGSQSSKLIPEWETILSSKTSIKRITFLSW